MSKRHLFPKSAAKTKAEDYHRGCNFTGSSPDLAARGMKSLNLDIPFEDALRLKLALDSALHSLNRYNRGTTKGRSMGVLLSIKIDNSSIVVIEKSLTE